MLNIQREGEKPAIALAGFSYWNIELLHIPMQDYCINIF